MRIPRVHNVHVRELPAPQAQAGALLDRLGRPGDPLWPTSWPPMVLADPIAVGVTGRHGPIRYHVSRFRSGREIEFTFSDGVGLRGTHTFTVEPVGPQHSRLRHVVDGKLYGPMLLIWPLVMHWLHDAAVEDLMDRAERASGAEPIRPARWSPWVRLIRSRDGVAR